MKRFITIAAVSAFIVLGIFGILFGIQVDTHVDRSIEIKASLENIKSEVSDFKKFSTWSPWANIDPNATHSFSDAQGVVGAKFSWESDHEELGTGYQVIKSITDERVEMDLVFTAPWEGESIVYYTFENLDNGIIKVTWGMDGEGPLAMKGSIEDMVGERYEEGLASLKDKLENK